MDNFIDFKNILNQTIDTAKASLGGALYDTQESIKAKLGQSIDERQKALGLGGEINQPPYSENEPLFGGNRINIGGMNFNPISLIIMILAAIVIFSLLKK